MTNQPDASDPASPQRDPAGAQPADTEGSAQQVYPPVGYAQRGYPPAGYAQQGYPPPGYQQAGLQPGYGAHGDAQPGYGAHGNPPGYGQQGNPPGYGAPPAGYGAPPGVYPSQVSQQAGYPHQGYPQSAYQHPGYQQGYQSAGYPTGPAGYPTASGSAGGAPDDATAVVGARVGQYIVDNLVVSIPLFVLWSLAVGLLTSFAASVASTSEDPSSVGSALGGLFMGVIGVLTLLSITAGWLVMAWWPAKHNGQTPAMRWFNLRIITEDGGQATLGALTVRWLLLIVDGIFGGLVGLVIMLNSPRHQRLGDRVAKTLVVRTA